MVPVKHINMDSHGTGTKLDIWLPAQFLMRAGPALSQNAMLVTVSKSYHAV